MEIARCRIVVVEDDPVICWLLSRQFEALFCESVTYFESREEALIHLRVQEADLIISNLHLSDGWADKTYISALCAACQALLILTGLRDENLQPAFDTKLPLTFLYKPFTWLQLKTCIEAL